MLFEGFPTQANAEGPPDFLWWLLRVGVPALTFIAGTVCGGFFRRLGENWADRLALTKTRRAAEKAQKEFEEFLERLRHQLRHAESTATIVAERRIDAHQAAYRILVRARELARSYRPGSSQEREKMVNDMKEWHLDHCLYLTSESNQAFLDSYYSLFFIDSLYDDVKDESDEKEIEMLRKMVEFHRQRVEHGPGVIMTAVSLPAIGVIQSPESTPADSPTK